MIIFIAYLFPDEDDVINYSDLTSAMEEIDIPDGPTEEISDSPYVDLYDDISSNHQPLLIPDNQQTSPPLYNQQSLILRNNQRPQRVQQAPNTRSCQQVQPSPCLLSQIIVRGPKVKNANNSMPYNAKIKLQEIKWRPAHLQTVDEILEFAGNTQLANSKFGNIIAILPALFPK